MSSRISAKCQSSGSKDPNPKQNLEMESDDVKRIGEVFFVRSGLESSSLLHHWALGVRFCDNLDWVLIEGDNFDGRLTSRYRFFKAENFPKDYQIFKLDKLAPQLRGLDDAQFLTSIFTITTVVKALLTKTLDKVNISPMQLRAIAESIENEPYVLGLSDCHTWFLIAFSKLESYKVTMKPTLTEKAIAAVVDTFQILGLGLAFYIGRKLAGK